MPETLDNIRDMWYDTCKDRIQFTIDIIGRLMEFIRRQISGIITKNRRYVQRRLLLA